MVQYKRRQYMEQLIARKDNGRIKVITGLRRAGKSYLLFNLYRQYLLDNGVGEDQIIGLALDEIDNAKYRNPFELNRAVKERMPDQTKRYYVFIDEIQFVTAVQNPYVDDPEGKITFIDVVLGLMKLPNADIYVTGSNSKMLSSDILTQFRDRGDEIRVYPLSFAEFYNEYEGLDFGRLEDLTDDDVTKALCSYLGSVQPSRQNEYTGLFEGYNLIYICAESFSSMAIDEEITPTLYKMANSGIVLNNYYNSFRNTTTNGEYAFLTGLWPDVARQNTNMGVVTGTMGQSIEKDMSIALGNTFAFSEGLSGRAYHNYYGYYYGRNQSLPNMGFTCKFMDDGMHFTTAWPSSDYELMEQSVDDYIDSDRFLTYYMTFSGHGNYTTNNVMVARNYDHVSEMVDDDIDYTALGYLSCHYELEKAMAYLLERLEDAGKLDNTVIVLTGDHYPYYLSDEGYEDLRGEPVDEDFGSYKSTCIIYNAGLGRTISVDTPCCNVDILPTIYNLFNVQYDSRLYAGTDIFGDGLHMAELYNKSFISEYVKYNYATGETTWLVDENRYDRGFLDHHLESALLTAKNRYAMSIEVEETDFYKFVFDNYQRKQRVAKDAEETEQVDAYTGHMKDSE